MYKLCFIILIWGLSGLSSFAQSKLFKKGIVQKDIYFELPFEVFHGHIIVQAEVQGATQRFLFDTGAPNLISRKFLSDKMPAKTLKVTDSQNQKGKMALGIIDSLTLGGVNFYNYAVSSRYSFFLFRWSKNTCMASRLNAFRHLSADRPPLRPTKTPYCMS